MTAESEWYNDTVISEVIKAAGTANHHKLSGKRNNYYGHYENIVV